MKNRYEIHKGEFDGCQKIQYYIWDINMKRTVVLILHGGIRAAKAIRKVLAIITLALLLAGCVHVKLPDGTEYWRLGEQQIGEVLFTMPDGTEFLMVRQKSIIPVLIVTPAGWQLGEARKVK